jgi:predicted nucleic acid-binding protein
VSDEVHTSTLRELMAAETTRISFVDRTSFSFMRTEGLDVAIAFDRDFEREGFTVVP